MYGQTSSTLVTSPDQEDNAQSNRLDGDAIHPLCRNFIRELLLYNRGLRFGGWAALYSATHSVLLARKGDLWRLIF